MRALCHRFGKDINVIDLELYIHLDEWLDSATQVVATIVLVAMQIPLFILFVLPMSVVFFLIQVAYAEAILKHLNYFNHLNVFM